MLKYLVTCFDCFSTMQASNCLLDLTRNSIRQEGENFICMAFKDPDVRLCLEAEKRSENIFNERMNLLLL